MEVKWNLMQFGTEVGSELELKSVLESHLKWVVELESKLDLDLDLDLNLSLDRIVFHCMVKHQSWH